MAGEGHSPPVEARIQAPAYLTWRVFWHLGLWSFESFFGLGVSASAIS